MNAHHRQKDWISGRYFNSSYVSNPFVHADVSSISSISTIADFQRPSCHVLLLLALFGLGAMSDMSSLSASKRRPPAAPSLWVHAPKERVVPQESAILAAAFSALERNHHEEDVIGPRCRRDFGPFRSPAGLCWSAHLSRTRRLSVLVGLCRCPGWRADPPLLLAYPALLGRLCLARAPRAHLRLIRLRLVRCLDRRTRRCDVGDESHRGRLWATACQPRGALFQFAILLGRHHDRPIVCFWHFETWRLCRAMSEFEGRPDQSRIWQFGRN